MTSSRLHAVLVFVVVLAAAPIDAAAQAPAARDLGTSSFGNWSLSATSDRGLQIANRLRPGAVRLRLTHASNGWFWLETLRDQYIMWSGGNFDHQSFEFDDAKPDPGAPALAPGTYTFGTWTIRVTADELTIEHPDNPHRIVLPRDADGWVGVRGLRSRGDLTVRPEDELAQDGP